MTETPETMAAWIEEEAACYKKDSDFAKRLRIVRDYLLKQADELKERGEWK